MVVAVKVLPVGSKPPAAVVVRISKHGRHDLGAASPLSTTTSSLQERDHVETGRVGLRAGINPASRKAIPMHRLYYCSGPPCPRGSWCMWARLPP